MKLKDVKKGEYFMLSAPKEGVFAKPTQVYLRGEYDRTEKKYLCTKFSDICSSRLVKGDKEVYTDFLF